MVLTRRLTMNIRDFIGSAVDLYRAGTPLALEGAPGVGKSSIIRKEFVERIEAYIGRPIGYHEELVPTLDAPDVRGFLVPTKDADGNAISKFTYPGICPSQEYLREYPIGVYFLDEFETGDILTKKALAPTILEGGIGNAQLPPGWLRVMASNRMSDRSGAGKPLMHVMNRTRKVGIDSDLFSWVLWAEANGVHPMFVAWAKSRPGILFTNEVPAEPKPFCTPRSGVEAAKYMAIVAGVDEKGNPNMVIPSDGVTQEFVAGSVGDGAAADMFGYFKVADFLPTIQQVEANPSGCKLPPMERLDAAYAAVQMCIHHAAAPIIDKLWTYIERLPKELQVSAAKSLLEKSGGALLNSQALGKWIAQNRALVMSSTRK
jgi:hypothetical protein